MAAFDLGKKIDKMTIFTHSERDYSSSLPKAFVLCLFWVAVMSAFVKSFSLLTFTSVICTRLWLLRDRQTNERTDIQIRDEKDGTIVI